MWARGDLSLAGSWRRGFVSSANAKPGARTRRDGSNPRSSIRRPAVNAAKITRNSKSNLALAFVALGRERRNDITIFYAFCRVVDDIADSSEATFSQKAADLRAWRTWIREPTPGEPALARDVRGLYAKY